MGGLNIVESGWYRAVADGFSKSVGYKSEEEILIATK